MAICWVWLICYWFRGLLIINFFQIPYTFSIGHSRMANAGWTLNTIESCLFVSKSYYLFLSLYILHLVFLDYSIKCIFIGTLGEGVKIHIYFNNLVCGVLTLSQHSFLCRSYPVEADSKSLIIEVSFFLNFTLGIFRLARQMCNYVDPLNI